MWTGSNEARLDKPRKFKSKLLLIITFHTWTYLDQSEIPPGNLGIDSMVVHRAASTTAADRIVRKTS